MAKKHKHEEHENHERWLVSYADFITLLFAFFVVMYSVSRVDNKRMVAASQSLKWALHFQGTGGVGELPIFEGPPSEGGCAANTGSGAWATPEGIAAMEKYKKKLERRLKPYLQEKKVSSTVAVEARAGRLTVRLSAAHFFDPSLAALRPEALPVIDAIGDELKLLDRPVRVEAHTDDTPLTPGKFRTNWDLSAARASTVVALLEQGHSMPPSHLSAAGMGAAYPLVKNDSDVHREQNRRVELVVELSPESIGNSRAK